MILGASGDPLIRSRASNGRPDPNETTEPSSNGGRGTICTSKGMMCEVLCKNNPQAGGKVCK